MVRGQLAPLVPGAPGIVNDTALRGVHHQRLLRELGLMPINRVTAAEKGSSRPRRAQGRRVEKSVHVEDKRLSLPPTASSRRSACSLGAAPSGSENSRTGATWPSWSWPGSIPTGSGTRGGWYRWYNDYALPDRYGAGTITVRLHGTREDRARKLNRTENVRPIAPTDPDFRRLYARRNDGESINRGVVDSLYLGRPTARVTPAST